MNESSLNNKCRNRRVVREQKRKLKRGEIQGMQLNKLNKVSSNRNLNKEVRKSNDK